MLLDGIQVVLLRTQDGPRSGNSNPADESISRDLVLSHGPEADEGSCSAQSCLAVDCNPFRSVV